MKQKIFSAQILSVIASSVCLSCTTITGTKTADENSAASQVLTEYTLMPEQKCPAKLHGKILVLSEVLHQSAKLCYYRD